MPGSKELPISVSVTPTLEKVKQQREKRLTQLKRLEVVNARIATFLDTWVQRNFKTEGGKVGGWAPFAAGGRWRRGVGLDTSAKLEQDTGRLSHSFLPFWSKQNAGIGSDLDYAKKQNDGDPANGLPARRMLPKKKEVMPDVKKITENRLDETVLKP